MEGREQSYLWWSRNFPIKGRTIEAFGGRGGGQLVKKDSRDRRPLLTTPRLLISLVGACLVAFLATASQPAAAAPANAEDLVGLWTAKKRFGPDAHGVLILQKKGGGWTADFLGQTLAIRSDGAKLEFAYKGSTFTGRLTPRGAIRGRWTQRQSIDYGYGYSTPVTLDPDGQGRWRGLVRPKVDELTFFLKVERRPDGRLSAFLRNPERNVGREFDVDHLLLDGDAVKLIGKSGGKGENQTLIKGSYEAGKRALLLKIPGYYADDIYTFTPDSDLSTFYPRGRNPGRYVYRAPIAGEDGWPVATLEETRISRAGIEKFIQMLIDMPIASVGTPEVHGILIARHGKLVLEEYFHGEHRDKLHDTRSAGKSVVATVVGAAMQAGIPLKLSSPVYQVMNGGAFPPDLDPRKRAMTLEHLLKMRSGHHCDDSKPEAPGNEVTMWRHSISGSEPSTYLFTQRLPLDREPGTVSIYCSSDPNLALGMVGRAAKESPLDVFERLIADPLKIKYYAWNIDGADEPYGGGGSRFLPRDLLKFGQLMLNGGTWGGRRILSRDFVARASAPLHDLKRIQYGLLWWSIEFPYKNRTLRAFFAGGNGGQGIMVVPELDLVTVTIAGNYMDPVGLHIQQDLPANYILPAVRELGDDINAPVTPGNFHTPYGLPGVPNPR